MLPKVSRKPRGIAAGSNSSIQYLPRTPCGTLRTPPQLRPRYGSLNIDRVFRSRGPLLARHASKIEDSDSPAWKILHSRLVADASVGDAPTENPVPIPSVIEIPGRDLMLFATSMPEHQGPVTFAGSLLVHVLAAAVIWFSLGYKPPSARVITEHYTIRQLDLSELADRLRPLGRIRANEFALRFEIPSYVMTVFPDGRVIVKGTTDAGVARSLYARYIGA